MTEATGDHRRVSEVPAYGLAEAARYVRVAPATLRSWVVGRAYPSQTGDAFFQPLICPPAESPPQLSFENLIEAHVLSALRGKHNVLLKHVRSALTYAQAELGIDRLLLSRELHAAAGNVFLARYGHLVNLSKSGQLAVRKILEAHLERIEWNETDLPIRLHPFTVSATIPDDRVVAIDPTVGFGRPLVWRVGVSTAAIADRIDAGEDLGAVADDYGLTVDEAEAAILFERAA